MNQPFYHYEVPLSLVKQFVLKCDMEVIWSVIPEVEVNVFFKSSAVILKCALLRPISLDPWNWLRLNGYRGENHSRLESS